MLSSDNLRGAVFMALSMAGFVVNDAFMKSVLTEVDLFTAIFWRGLVVTLILGAFCWWSGVFAWRWNRRDGRLVAQRAVAEILATITFLTALSHMPIAAATAILQSLPLAVTLAAAVFLAEPVGWRRLSASAIGFLGVLLIVRPGAEDFTVYSLFAVASVAVIVLRDLTTRRLSRGVPTALVALITASVITLTGLLGSGGRAVTGGLPLAEAGALAGAAGFLIVGYIFSVSSMRHGEIDFVSPFRYTILIWAILLGILFFDEWPDYRTWIGATVVIAAGLYTFLRERQLKRRQR